jgi:hypothetical protein
VEIRPGANLNFDWGATKLTASYLYDNRYYFRRKNTDQSHDFELAFDHSFSSRYSMTASDSFVIAQEPEVIAGSGALASPIRDEGNNLRNTANLSMTAQLTPLFGLVLGYANSIYDYQENFGNSLVPSNPSYSALLDRDENTLSIDTTWQIMPETTGVFGYQFGAVFYTSDESILNDPLPLLGSAPPYPHSGPYYVNSNTRNNFSHTIYVGLDHSFLPNLSGSVRAGVQYLDYYNDVDLSAPGFPKQAQSSWSPYADLSLTYAYVDGSLKVGFRHSHNQTDQSANAADLGAGLTEDEDTSLAYLNLSQKLTPVSPRLTATASAEYQNSTFNMGPVNGETDDYYLFGVGLNYAFNQYFYAETGYNYDLIVSDIAGRGYNRSQVFVGLGATY